MNKSEYISKIGGEYDTGFADGQAKKERDILGSAYDSGFDSNFMPTSFRPVVVETASRGWDNGASGAVSNNTPQLDASFANTAVLDDLKRVYDDAYDSGKTFGAAGPGDAPKTSYVGWIAAAAAAVVIGAGVLYTMKKKQGHQSPALANANPSKQRKILGTTGDVNMFDYDAGVIYENEHGVQWEWWHWDNEEDESGKAGVTVYRDNVADNVWEDKDWTDAESVAATLGADVEEIRAKGKSPDPLERAYVLESIEWHYGADELDQYPLQMTRSDLKKRWGRVKMPR
jgi:hypothetical protein